MELLVEGKSVSGTDLAQIRRSSTKLVIDEVASMLAKVVVVSWGFNEVHAHLSWIVFVLEEKVIEILLVIRQHSTGLTVEARVSRSLLLLILSTYSVM